VSHFIGAFQLQACHVRLWGTSGCDPTVVPAKGGEWASREGVCSTVSFQKHAQWPDGTLLDLPLEPLSRSQLELDRELGTIAC